MPRFRDSQHKDHFTGTLSPNNAWRQLCDMIVRELGGTRAIILPLSGDRYVPWIAHSAGYGKVLEQFYNEGWTVKDLQIEIGNPDPARGYLLKEDLKPSEAGDKSPLYRFFLSSGPAEGWFGFVVTSRNISWIVSVNAPLRGVAEEQVCTRKIHELQLKVAIQLETAAVDFETRWQEVSLAHQHVGVGLLVLNVVGDVIEADVKAVGFLKRFGAQAHRGNFKKQFSHLYFSKGSRQDMAFSGPYIIGQSDDALLSASIIRLPQSLRMITCEAIEIISLSVKESFADTLRAVMLNRFGLLPSEAELALLICEGRKVKEAAELIRIKESTARQRLKAVFRKVEVETQHQLIVVLFQQAGIVPLSKSIKSLN